MAYPTTHSSRSRKRPAASTFESQPEEALPAPVRPAWLPNHQWLTFDADLLSMSVRDIYHHLSRMEDRPFGIIVSLDTSLDETQALLSRVQEFTSHSSYDATRDDYFSDHSFTRLVRSRDQVFPVLCYEFFSTAFMDLESPDYGSDTYISFRLGGVSRSCSLLEFAHRLGLYTETEIADPRLLPYLQSATTFSNADFDLPTFWPQVANGVYHSEVPVSSLRDPVLRFLLRLVMSFYLIMYLFFTFLYIDRLLTRRLIISHIQLRREVDKINRMDLFFLWCFFNHRPLNIAHILASQLSRRGYAARRDSPILGGHLVTKLARSFGVDTTGLDVRPCRLFARASFQSNRLVHKVGKGGFIIPAADPVVAYNPRDEVVVGPYYPYGSINKTKT